MAQTPSIPKGTRDYSPEVMVKRNYIFDTIKSVFKLYGYLPLETPAMENLSTLMGKYGEEGDKLLFKILNSGDFLAPVTNSEVEERNIPRLTNKICEKGLRYDLAGKEVSATRTERIGFAGSDTKHLNATGRAFGLSRIRFGGRGLFTKKASYFTKLNHKLSFVTMIGL